jgi:hypothetical protein
MGLITWAIPFLMLATVPASAAPSADPADYLWKSRVLITFATHADDPALAEQTHTVTAAQAGMAERDLVLLRHIGDDDALRRRYGVAGKGFEVLLIGKDGGVKLRSDHPIAAADLFQTVDAMPMRKDELRRQ